LSKYEKAGEAGEMPKINRKFIRPLNPAASDCDRNFIKLFEGRQMPGTKILRNPISALYLPGFIAN
jgi:hypothetical protein